MCSKGQLAERVLVLPGQAGKTVIGRWEKGVLGSLRLYY